VIQVSISGFEPLNYLHWMVATRWWDTILHHLCSKMCKHIIGASLSEPHTSMTALQDVCVCMYVCLLVAIYRKFKLNERMRRISNLHTC